MWKQSFIHISKDKYLFKKFLPEQNNIEDCVSNDCKENKGLWDITNEGKYKFVLFIVHISLTHVALCYYE